MLIDDSKKLRREILKTFPAIKNTDVIIYNKLFLPLAEKNVEQSFRTNRKKLDDIGEQIDVLEEFMNVYEERINEVAQNGALSEQDYIKRIQNLEKNYSDKFKPIKTLEGKIQVYRNSLDAINYKIDEQRAKEYKQGKEKEQEFENQKTKLITQMRKVKSQIDLLNDRVKFEKYKVETLKKYLNEVQIEEFQQIIEEAKLLQGKYLLQIDELEKQKEKVQKSMVAFNTEVQKNEILKYNKKSITVLKYEGQRAELIKALDLAENELKIKESKTTLNYRVLKTKIQSDKESLENLIKINAMKETAFLKQEELNSKSDEASKLKEQIVLEYNFLKVKHKLMERKISDTLGNNLKFVLFEEDDKNLRFTECLKLYFNNVQLEYCDPIEQKQVNQIILDKLSMLATGGGL